MIKKYFLTALVFLFPFDLPAQHFVDVLPDATYVQEYSDSNKEIYKINLDLSVERILIPAYKFSGFLLASPRPKIRFDSFWISDGQKIYRRHLDAILDQEWEPVKLPDGIEQFFDFEIISDREAMLFGVYWHSIHSINDNEHIPMRYDMNFIYNYKTGIVTKTIEMLDPRNILITLDHPSENISILLEKFDNLMKILSVYSCRFDSKILIVGAYSGLVTVFDTSNGRSRVFEIIPKDEMPSDPGEVSQYGYAIPWIGPLSGNDVLICCRKLVAPDKTSKLVSEAPALDNTQELIVAPNNNTSEPISVYCFRTLNLKTGKITFEGAEYRGQMAKSNLTLYEENSQLLSVRDLISERVKQLEQTETNSDTPANK